MRRCCRLAGLHTRSPPIPPLPATGLSSGQVDYWEVNEAFSVVDLANRQLLGLDPDRWAGSYAAAPAVLCLGFGGQGRHGHVPDMPFNKH